MKTIKLEKIPLSPWGTTTEVHYYKTIGKDIFLSIVKFTKDNYDGRWEAYSNDKLFCDILIDNSLKGIINQLKEKNIHVIINDGDLVII